MGEKLLLTEHGTSMGRALLGTRPALTRWLLIDRDRGLESRRPWHGHTGAVCSWSILPPGERCASAAAC